MSPKLKPQAEEDAKEPMLPFIFSRFLFLLISSAHVSIPMASPSDVFHDLYHTFLFYGLYDDDE